MIARILFLAAAVSIKASENGPVRRFSRSVLLTRRIFVQNNTSLSLQVRCTGAWLSPTVGRRGDSTVSVGSGERKLLGYEDFRGQAGLLGMAGMSWC